MNTNIDFKTAATAIMLVNETLEWLLAEARWERDEKAATLGRVEELHVRGEWDHGIFVCEHCRSIEYDALDDIDTYSTRVEWPCPTVAAVRGEAA